MKIIGVGLSRTGTSSLNEALAILGFNCQHFLMELEELNKLDGTTDLPMALKFREIDDKFPGSKFIMTLRDSKDWHRSCRRHFRDEPIPRSILRGVRIDAFGCLTYNQKKFHNSYREHLSEVRKYFNGRDEDYLELNICHGEGWDRLCAFLEVEIPSVDFPHANRGKSP